MSWHRSLMLFSVDTAIQVGHSCSTMLARGLLVKRAWLIMLVNIVPPNLERTTTDSWKAFLTSMHR